MTTHHQRHSAPIGVIPVPHGPETGQEHEDYPREHTTEYERQIFGHVTRPDDSYTPEGTYWADLPFWQRVSFVSKVDRDEAAKELKATGEMMKKDPLSPLGWYFRNAVLPGAGLGLEGYVLFSIGNLEPLFAAAWPECWGKSHSACSQNWVASVTYLEIVGIMIGQAAVGVSNSCSSCTQTKSNNTSGHRRLDWPPLGSYSGRRHHVRRSAAFDWKLG